MYENIVINCKHKLKLTQQLYVAKSIAEYSIEYAKNNNKLPTTKSVKIFGMKSEVSNQIIRKYARNKNTKQINNIIIPITGRDVIYENGVINIKSLKLKFDCIIKPEFERICYMELDEIYAHICLKVIVPEKNDYTDYIGVDLNSTGHIAVVAIPKTGKVVKMGKNIPEIRNKYQSKRRKLQKANKYKPLERIGCKESNKINNELNKIANGIVDYAYINNSNIRLEQLTNIRKKNRGKQINRSINNWPFYKLQTKIENKAKMFGIKVEYIDPMYTSQRCSRCGRIGDRKSKVFTCSCGFEDHADVNAAFNIALNINGLVVTDRDVTTGSIDTPIEIISNADMNL